jgi:flagellin
MVIKHNIAAENAGRYLKTNTGKLSKSLEKLSSGYTINRAGDNAAGLAVSEKMRAQIAGLDQAVNNAQDGISMVQTFEGALMESHNILMRMKHLSAQSANGTYTDETDRAAIELEYEQLAEELNDIAETDFNGITILDGSSANNRGKKMFDVGDETAKTNAAYLEEILNAISPLDNLKDPNIYGAANVQSGAADLLTVIPGVKTELQDILNKMPNNDATAAKRRTLKNSLAMLDSAEKRAKVIADGTITDPDELGEACSGVNGLLTTVRSMPHNAADDKNGTDTSLLKALDDAKSFVFAIKSSKTDGELSINDMSSASLGLDRAAVATVVGASVSNPATIAPLLDTVERGYDDLQNQTAKLWFIRDNIKDKTETAMMLDTALDALNKQRELVLKMKDILVTVVTNPELDGADGRDGRKVYADQLRAISKELDEIADTTEYNGVMLLDGTYTDQPLEYDDFGVTPAEVSLQVGARTKDLKRYDFNYAGVWAGDLDLKEQSIGELETNIYVTAAGLGLETDKVNLASQKNANAAIDIIGYAVNKVSMIRGTFGAIQNRLEHKVTNLNNTMENLTAAESRIRDTDMAAEMMNFTKEQIVMQASQSMLAQGNGLPQSALSLLQG